MITALIILISLITYLVVGHIALKVFDHYRIIEYNWNYDPIAWFFALIFWPLVYIYWGIVKGSQAFNKNHIEPLTEQFIKWLEGYFPRNKNRY